MAIAVGTRLGAYEVKALLGAGAMGEVYRAHDATLGRDVAIKVLPEAFTNDPDRVARFLREAQALAALNHPHIAQIYGLEDAGRALVMELVDGEDLAVRIGRGPLALSDALAIARQIADALDAAHEQGIIHRDLKPANVKVRRDGAIKVLDFGLAKTLEPVGSPVQDDARAPTVAALATQAGVIVGTAAYMAPEQARGRTVDRRADIWAFGCVLYEMLTGRHAFGGETVTDVLAAVVHEDPDWSALPEGTPPRLRTLLTRCLEKDPRRRLRDIGDARLDLDSQAVGQEAAGVARPPTRRRDWRDAAVLLAVAGVAGTIAWMAARRAAPMHPEPLRLVALTEPGELEFNDRYAGMGINTLNPVIAPDGSRVVLQQGGRLWIRAIDRLEPRALEGTDGALDAFWSPDSSTLAFFTATELRRIAADGGPSTLITTLPTTTQNGGTWGPGDRIVVAIVGRGLFAVPARGGTLAPFLEARIDQGDVDFHAPAFLPGGQSVAFVTHQADFTTARIEVFDGRQRRRLWEAPPGAVTSRAVASPDGRAILAWVERVNPGIWLIPLDLRSLAVAGDPELIVPDGLAPSVANDGTLVYTSGVRTAPDRLVRVSHDGHVLGAVGRPLWDMREPVLSPNGAQVLTWAQHEGPADLWVHDIARAAASRITTNADTEGHAIWADRGDAILYARMLGSGVGLFKQAADGSGAAQQVQDAAVRTVSASRDGQTMVYATVPDAAAGSSDLWIASTPPAKASPLVATPATEMQPAVSPDGALLAYVANYSGRPEVYVQPLPRGRRVLASPQGGVLPAWSRDGTELFYLEGTTLMGVRVEPHRDLSIGAPFKLFSAADVSSPLSSFDFRLWCPSDEGFLIVQRGVSGRPFVAAVQNWQHQAPEP